MTPRALATMLTCLASIAQAQTREALELPYLDTAETRYGTLTVGQVQLDGYEGQQLLLNGTPVEGLADVYVAIQDVRPMPDDDGQDWVLVSVAGGGNACPTLWAFVTVSAEGARATPPFGTCSEGVLDLRATEDALLALDMVGIAENDNLLHTYTFDGIGLKVTEFTTPLD
jgi:hypothetical protein